MKNLFYLILLVPFFVFGQTESTVLYNWDDPAIVGSNAYDNAYNEIWGVVANNKEIAIIGSTAGTHFFDVTDTSNPQELTGAFVPGAVVGGSIIHRDYHDYQCYLYAVADEGTNSTLQIIDYSNLPATTTVMYDDGAEINRAHNIFIDTSSALLYAVFVRSNTSNRQNLRVFSLADPINPTLVGTYNDIEGRTISGAHDIIVRDDLAYINCGYNGFVVADFSDAANPTLAGTLDNYPQKGYNHSGWLSDDGDYYYMADETHSTDIKVLDITDLSNIVVTDTIDAGNASPFSIPHNLIVRGNYLYASYYYDGLQVFDLTDPAHPVRSHFYDTYPGADRQSYEGAWGVFPYLPSGNVLISDMQSGLYLFEKMDEAITGTMPLLGTTSNCGVLSSNNEVTKQTLEAKIFPKPASDFLTIEVNSEKTESADLELYDITGKLVQQVTPQQLISGTNQWTITIKESLNPGMYILRVKSDSYIYSEKLILE